MIDARALLVAMLDEVERDATLRARMRRVLGAAPREDDPLVGWRDEGIPRETFFAACKSKEIAGARLVGRQRMAPRSSVRAWIASLPACRTRTPKPEAPEEPEEPADDLDRLIARARRTA